MHRIDGARETKVEQGFEEHVLDIVIEGAGDSYYGYGLGIEERFKFLHP